jgi:Uma2 family endonuclease
MVVKAPISAKTFERLADGLGPCELVRGEIVQLMASGETHSAITATVTVLLGVWARRSRRGRVLAGEAGVITQRGPDTVRGIDVAYMSYKRLPRGKEGSGFSRVPPELAVEIVGEKQGWREMLEKSAEYLRMGVDRVWILDPQTRSLHIHRADREPEILRNSSVVQDAEVLPGFRCRVREFFQ